jgi:hypothetical protein
LRLLLGLQSAVLSLSRRSQGFLDRGPSFFRDLFSNSAQHRLVLGQLFMKMPGEPCHIHPSGALAVKDPACRLNLCGVFLHQGLYIVSLIPLHQCSSFLQPFACGSQMKLGVVDLAKREGQANPLTGQLDGIEGVAGQAL